MSAFLVTTQSPTTHSCSASFSPIVRPVQLPFEGRTDFIYAVDIPPSQVNILDGNAEDLIAECNAYESRIKQCGGIELFLGGIGEDGHIAFNEPGMSHSFHHFTFLCPLMSYRLWLLYRIVSCHVHRFE